MASPVAATPPEKERDRPTNEQSRNETAQEYESGKIVCKNVKTLDHRKNTRMVHGEALAMGTREKKGFYKDKP